MQGLFLKDQNEVELALRKIPNSVLPSFGFLKYQLTLKRFNFQNYMTLKIFYDSLRPAVNHLNYWGSEITSNTKSPCGRSRSLLPIEGVLNAIFFSCSSAIFTCKSDKLEEDSTV